MSKLSEKFLIGILFFIVISIVILICLAIGFLVISPTTSLLLIGVGLLLGGIAMVLEKIFYGGEE